MPITWSHSDLYTDVIHGLLGIQIIASVSASYYYHFHQAPRLWARVGSYRGFGRNGYVISQAGHFALHRANHYQYASHGGRVWRLRPTLCERLDQNLFIELVTCKAHNYS